MPEALARAADLEEHGLHKCAAFAEWARTTAGPGPYTDQMVRLVRAVAKPHVEGQREPDDVCAALREGRFSPHRRQVAVVMAARELGIPADGFASASREADPPRRHLHGPGGLDPPRRGEAGRRLVHGRAASADSGAAARRVRCGAARLLDARKAPPTTRPTGVACKHSRARSGGAARRATNRSDTTEARAVSLAEACR